jgi:TonB family protein
MGNAGGSGVLVAIRDDLIYPCESCLAGREGAVVARYTLLRNGDVEDVRVQKSSGDPLLDREVVRALESLSAHGKKVAWPSSEPEKQRTVREVAVHFVLY